jgi:tRNA A37 N6-isopentenylltransferase MiaA
MPSVGKGLGVMMMLLKKLRSGCEYKIQTRTRRGKMLVFFGGTGLLKLMVTMRKSEVCNTAIQLSYEYFQRIT